MRWGRRGFIVSKGHVYLTGQEAIFNFVSEGLQHLQELAEVYLSNDLQAHGRRASRNLRAKCA